MTQNSAPEFDLARDSAADLYYALAATWSAWNEQPATTSKIAARVLRAQIEKLTALHAAHPAHTLPEEITVPLVMAWSDLAQAAYEGAVIQAQRANAAVSALHADVLPEMEAKYRAEAARWNAAASRFAATAAEA